MKASVLLVDDEESVLDFYEHVLTQEGFNVLTAIDGLEALREMQQSSIDVAVVDILMPRKEGLETIQAIREEFPGVGIIAMSGGGIIAAGTYLDLAGKFGAHRCFEKPVPVKLMVDAINDLAKKMAKKANDIDKKDD